MSEIENGSEALPEVKHDVAGEAAVDTNGVEGVVTDHNVFVPGEAESTVPTEMITDEMREAGVDETTPLKTREEVVAEVGEEAVAAAEAEELG